MTFVRSAQPTPSSIPAGSAISPASAVPGLEAAITRRQSWAAIREPVSTGLKIILGMIPIILIFVIWTLLTSGEAESRVISPLILPSPLEVLQSFKSLWFEAELTRSLLASTWRIVLGFLFGVLISLPLSCLVSSSLSLHLK